MHRCRPIASVILALSLLWHLAIPLVSLAEPVAEPAGLTLTADDGDRDGVWVPRSVDAGDTLRDLQPHRLRLPRRGGIVAAGQRTQRVRWLEQRRTPRRGAYPSRQQLCATQARDGDPPA